MKAHPFAQKTALVFIAILLTAPWAHGEVSPGIDHHLRSLKQLDQATETDDLKTKEAEEITGQYFCKVRTYKGAPGFNSFMFSKANSDVLYPGSLLQSQSIADKTYIPSGISPGAITLTVNLQSLQGPISRKIDHPSYSSVQSAIHEILSQNITGDAGAEMSWSIDNVYSKEHMKAKLGMDFKVADIFGGSGSLGMDFSASTRKAIIHFNQKYYDATIDLPKQPSDLVDPTSSLDAIKAVTGKHSPAYISSVSYGRYVLFTFETSDLSMNLEQELKAAITVPVEGTNVKAGANSNIDAGFKNGSLKSNAYILGGSGKLASMAINSLESMIDFIKTGGGYSKDSPGKPISYNLRYLSNNSPLRTVRATEYSTRDCVRIFKRYRVDIISFKLDKIQGISLPQIDLSGNLSVKGSVGNPETLWTHGLLEYPIRAGSVKKVNATTDLDFTALQPQARKEAFIDLSMGIRASWGLINEPFQPQSKRIYLKDIADDELTEEIETPWHRLTITYKITGLED